MISNSVGGVKEGAGEAALDSGGCRLGGGGLSSYIYHRHAESSQEVEGEVQVKKVVEGLSREM